jgi:hypothetical protein
MERTEGRKRQKGRETISVGFSSELLCLFKFAAASINFGLE